MIDQSFSAENFEKIFNIENRKGNIDKDTLPEAYIGIILKIKDKRREISSHLEDYKREIIAKDEFIKRRDDCDEKIEGLLLEKEKILYEYLKTISDAINDPKFKFKFNIGERDGKPIYELGHNAQQFYAIKQLEYNIRKTFKVKQSDRYRVLKQVKLLLSDGFPKIIVRTDVKSFYESIPQDRLLELVTNNTLLSYKSKFFISFIINEYEREKDKKTEPIGCGVPRGVGISAYLSELYMKDIDQHIKSLPNITFYARYVDDIIIAITPPSIYDSIDYEDIVRQLFLKYGLSIKEEKTQTIRLLRDADTKASLAYLGYKFDISAGSTYCNVKVSISDNKITKYKERLEKAFDDYNVNSKYNERNARRLLFKRLRFLSGNTNLLNSKKGIKVGVYYSNSLLDASDLGSLKAINCFLMRMVCTNLKPHCTTSFDIGKLKKYIINTFNFCDGFKNKRFHSFTTDDLIQIKKIWEV